MFIARVYGRKVSPERIDIGVALDNSVEQVQFVFSRHDNAVFLQPGVTAFLKTTTSTTPMLKIPLTVETTQTEFTCTWNILNTQIPDQGIKAAQIQIEIPDMQVQDLIYIWQSEPFQLNILRSIAVDETYSQVWYDELMELQARMDVVGVSTFKEVVFEGEPVTIEGGVLVIPTPTYVWGGNFSW